MRTGTFSAWNVVSSGSNMTDNIHDARNLVLVRHGESVWNARNLFTGWRDVELTTRGEEEARAAGRLLREDGFRFDVAFTSVLKRAIKTLWCILEEMELMWLPVHGSWRLNERHYGALQGKSKAEQVRVHGAEQVQLWRRGYDVRPPMVDMEDVEYPKRSRIYQTLTKAEYPRGESLKDTCERVMPYWDSDIAPALRAGNRVLVVAHGNSLRGLVKYIQSISDEDIVGMNMPTGVPRSYQLSPDLKSNEGRFHGDPDAIHRRISAAARHSPKD